MTSFCPPPRQSHLLKVITNTLRRLCGERDAGNLFGDLLENLLELTASEYGFIGEVFRDEKGRPYVKSYATTNIAWNDETQHLYEKAKEKGMVRQVILRSTVSWVCHCRDETACSGWWAWPIGPVDTRRSWPVTLSLS